MATNKIEILNTLSTTDYLKLNAQLAQKKNKLRCLLKEKGVLQKGGENKFDRYKYFSEAQYKELFTELFSASGLELSFDEIAYDTFAGSDKMPNGRMPKLAVYLTDTETGFFEATQITGEALDKGDKAGYKAYTGAIKYYLATTFLVATGDDPETESPEGRTGNKQTRPPQPTRRPAQRPQQEPPQAPAEPDPNAPIPRDAAKKLSLIIAEIAKEDQSWWPDFRDLHGLTKTTDIRQGDYNEIVRLANARLEQIKGKGGGDQPW